VNVKVTFYSYILFMWFALCFVVCLFSYAVHQLIVTANSLKNSLKEMLFGVPTAPSWIHQTVLKNEELLNAIKENGDGE